MCIPCDKTFGGTIIFYLLTLTLKFDLLLKNSNLGGYLVMVAARWASLSSDNSYTVIVMGDNVNALEWNEHIVLLFVLSN